MNLSDVHSVRIKRDRRRRVGRGEGSGRGKTSSRGMRGAASRTGAGGKISYEGGQMPMFRALPRRGFNNKRFQIPHEVVNLCDLAQFAAGTEVTPEVLMEAGLIGRRVELVKVLGNGAIEKPLTVKAHKFSNAAVEKIQAAGGKVEIIQ
ncbi:MAG TPA: 50S ribosomal protein L15 [Planctomycetota bacterium]|nr:50S ribosomal protein L15 [Planctomycetota bacterium]